MNLLFLTRADAFQNRGGDTIQLESLAAEFRHRGHDVKTHAGIRFALPPDITLVHIFNLQRVGEAAAQVARLAKRSVPVVISPIAGDTAALDSEGRSALRRTLAVATPEAWLEIGKHLRRALSGVGEFGSILPLLTRGPGELRRRVFRRCQGIYPNSEWEARWLETMLTPAQRELMAIVPNGVDVGLLQRGHGASDFRGRFGISFDRFVLSVARFDERKNNLRLIQAARRVGVPCVLVGKPAPLHRSFFERCAAEAQGTATVRIITEHMSQEELVGAYRAAWVHALPSWLETPGLSTLEAGLCGANLVVGECPAVREYLGEGAWYCDPGDVQSISSTLEEAIQAPRNLHEIAEIIQTRYSWRAVAGRQEQLYEGVLAGWAVRGRQ